MASCRSTLSDMGAAVKVSSCRRRETTKTQVATTQRPPRPNAARMTTPPGSPRCPMASVRQGGTPWPTLSNTSPATATTPPIPERTVQSLPDNATIDHGSRSMGPAGLGTRLAGRTPSRRWRYRQLAMKGHQPRMGVQPSPAGLSALRLGGLHPAARFHRSKSADGESMLLVEAAARTAPLAHVVTVEETGIVKVHAHGNPADPTTRHSASTKGCPPPGNQAHSSGHRNLPFCPHSKQPSQTSVLKSPPCRSSCPGSRQH